MECYRIKSKSQQLLSVMEKYYLIFKKEFMEILLILYKNLQKVMKGSIFLG